MADPTVYVSDELTTGILTRDMVSGRVPSLLVESLAWDSGFRGSGLVPGDAIVAVEGERLGAELRDATGVERSKLVGQYNEPSAWKDAGRKEGDPVTLTVRRRRYPDGFEKKKVTGSLRHKRDYRNAENQPTIWPGGPNAYEKDGFDETWPAWWERLGKQLVWVRCGGWQQDGMVTQAELKTLSEHKARVDLLRRKYPGSFADAVGDDYEAAVESMRGRAYPLTEADLAYRRADGERASEVAALASAAWAKCLEAVGKETIRPFPAEHPVFGRREDVVGRCVVLERIPTRNWIAEAGHNYLVAGSDSDGWYFMDAETNPAFRMFRAVRRYERLVTPSFREEYTVLARILPEARILVMNETGHWGLTAEPLAALVGEALFVDLREGGKESLFAGEEGLLKPRTALPPDDATPHAVLTALIDAVKAGDMALWKALFTDYHVFVHPEGATIHYHYSELRDSAWELSRRSLETRCYDARVVWVGEPYVLASGEEADILPRLEEVEAEVEHVGLFDGEYRAFKDITVNRTWLLRRMNNGPWRIASPQNL